MKFCFRAFSVLATLTAALFAQPRLPLDSLAAFGSPAASPWQIAGDLGADPRRDTSLTPLPGSGVLLTKTQGTLATSREFGDLDLEFDFLLTANADASVLLHGRYAVRLTDGAVASGIPPSSNATRAAGLWQHLQVEFRAPQFDSSGTKTSPARFAKITLNGFVIHENVTLSDSTFIGEKPLGSLVFSSSRGSVAFRKITTKPVATKEPTSASNAPVATKGKGKQSSSKSAKQAAKLTKIPVDVTDSVILQRGFIPYEPKKRLYATSVGTPAGVHYAYDFETGALLRVWRDRFIDAGEMWEGRSANQWAKPTGPALTLNAFPTIAFLASPADSDWPTTPDPLFSSQGYIVEPDGQPVFLSTLATLSIRDRIAPTTGARTLTRMLTLSGALPPEHSAFVLLATASKITPSTDGKSYVVGDREFYLDLAGNTAVPPMLLTRGGRQWLVVPVTATSLAQPIVSTLVW